MKARTLLVVMVSVFIAFSAVSCGKKNVKKTGTPGQDMTADITASPSLDVQDSTDAFGTEGSIRGGEFSSQETIKTVHFDFDRAVISDEARGILQKNADIIKTHKNWTILVEGHCDSRGTIEYNLALGQKRAKEIRDYYVRLGVSESSIGTISYGEEKPLCEEETEDCWAKNRRAETKVRAK